MTHIDSTKVKWRVQVRKSRAHTWKNKGLFETRAAARHAVWGIKFQSDFPWLTRVVRHISGKGRT